MLCEGIFVYLMLVVVFDSGKSYSRRFFALGWGKCSEITCRVDVCVSLCLTACLHIHRCNLFCLGLPAVIVAVSFGVRFDEYGSYA